MGEHQSKYSNPEIIALREEVVGRIKDQDAKVNNMSEELRKIRDDHLSGMKIDMATMKANLEWMIKFYWVLVTAASGSLVIGLINLLINN